MGRESSDFIKRECVQKEDRKRLEEAEAEEKQEEKAVANAQNQNSTNHRGTNARMGTLGKARMTSRSCSEDDA